MKDRKRDEDIREEMGTFMNTTIRQTVKRNSYSIRKE
jgi:hypothetical protein